MWMQTELRKCTKLMSRESATVGAQEYKFEKKSAGVTLERTVSLTKLRLSCTAAARKEA